MNCSRGGKKHTKRKEIRYIKLTCNNGNSGDV
uniref:Uncharacterized protein n=1 Tax=Arundo donax TaxID=35708 RepID=A0A0A9CE58_ARUDO